MSVVSQSGELESILQVKNISKVYNKNTTASNHLILNNLNIDIIAHHAVVKTF
jgi:hypothetical protein